MNCALLPPVCDGFVHLRVRGRAQRAWIRLLHLTRSLQEGNIQALESHCPDQTLKKVKILRTHVYHNSSI